MKGQAIKIGLLTFVGAELPSNNVSVEIIRVHRRLDGQPTTLVLTAAEWASLVAIAPGGDLARPEPGDAWRPSDGAP